MPVILAKAIPAKLFDVQAIRDELVKTSASEGIHVRSLMNITTNTWNEPPTFEVKTEVSANSIITKIYPQGTDKRAWKWVWLEFGTKERWAVLSDDWQNKTKVGRLKGGSGRGKFLRLANRPFKGIKPRNWRPIIVRLEDKRFKEKVDRAIERGLKKKKASP